MLKQNLSAKLLQKLSPQQIQFIKLLQMTTLDFEQKVDQELLDNPALEKGEDDDSFERAKEQENDTDAESNEYDYDNINISDYISNDDGGDRAAFHLNEDYSGDDEKEMPISETISFYEHLTKQARASTLNERQTELAIYLIGQMEEDGYLRRELAAIVNDLAFKENIQTNEDELEKVLIKIQNFDPAGVAARSLQECLLIQLFKKDTGDNPNIDIAIKIINKYMEAFSKKHYKKIMNGLGISEEELKAAMKEIVRLNPRPGQVSITHVKTDYIVPDFTVKEEEGTLQVTLNSRNAPELKLSTSYKETLQAYDKSDKKDKSIKDAAQYIKQKLDGAKWFIDSIRQRQNTLLNTMNAIVKRQEKFFFSGDEIDLKPMILKDIAEDIDMDISTISRVANSKYVQTQFGNFPLKFFFSEAITNSKGEEVSNREVKKILQQAIDAENKRKPLPDQALMELLKEKGYSIARRTVAKYREQLDIPVARLRKEL
jgi:RNA polymerase sigma-54 factor